jgi:hypothetical protein
MGLKEVTDCIHLGAVAGTADLSVARGTARRQQRSQYNQSAESWLASLAPRHAQATVTLQVAPLAM